MARLATTKSPSTRRALPARRGRWRRLPRGRLLLPTPPPSAEHHLRGAYQAPCGTPTRATRPPPMTTYQPGRSTATRPDARPEPPLRHGRQRRLLPLFDSSPAEPHRQRRTHEPEPPTCGTGTCTDRHPPTRPAHPREQGGFRGRRTRARGGRVQFPRGLLCVCTPLSGHPSRCPRGRPHRVRLFDCFASSTQPPHEPQATLSVDAQAL